MRASQTAAVLRCLILATLIGCVGASASPSRQRSADQQAQSSVAISESLLRAHLEFIASDDLEGRRTPSRGLDLAARYLASQLQRIGLEPAGGDGSYFQRFRVDDRAPRDRDSERDAKAQTPENGWTQNVVAILRGADADLATEYVALGAHYDHVGIGTADDSGDTIYNGADDDGSGTVALLALAESYASGLRPARSLLFVWHAGEEGGLRGSRMFADNPTVPREQIVAQLNIDMIGRSRAASDTSEKNNKLTAADEIYVIGPRIMSEDMLEIVERLSAEHGLRVNPLYDDIDQQERFFFRSDHVNYARHRIPVAFFFSGAHEDYHKPSDEVDRIDFNKLRDVAELIQSVGTELADRPERPRVNRGFNLNRGHD